MKPALLFCLMLTGLLAGCGTEHAGHDDEDSGERGAELFVKNKGVLLPPEMQRELGVTNADAAERAMPQHLEATAQVYQPASQTSPARAVAWFSESDGQALKVDQRLTLRPAHRGTDTIGGRIAKVEASPAVPGRIEAVIEFPDSAGQFQPGSVLIASFSPGGERKVLAVPESAVIRGASGAFVYAVNGAHYTRTPVKTGAASGGWVEIVEGLYAGDSVVSGGADALWLIELCALKGGSPCCPVPTRKRDD